MAIHVATFVQVHVDSITSDIFTKSGAKLNQFESKNLNKPTMRPREFTTEFRITPDASNTNTDGYPTLKTYLEAEATSGYKFKHVDQTYVITEN
jgi:hypothetical protein